MYHPGQIPEIIFKNNNLFQINDKKKTNQTFSTYTKSFLFRQSSRTISSERKPTFFSVYKIKSMRNIFILTSDPARSIWIFCLRKKLSFFYLIVKLLTDSWRNLHTKTRKPSYSFFIFRTNH